MKAEKDRVVILDYKLSTSKGALIESSVGRGAPVSFIHGRGFMLPGLDSRLDGVEAGEKKTFDLPPEDAFGTLEQQQTKLMSKSEFPDDGSMKVGSKFQAKLPPTNLQITLEVLEDKGDELEIRLIHPYANQTIVCEVEIIGVRVATPKELESGIVEAVARKAPTAPPPPPPPGDVDSLEELDVEPDEEEGDDEDKEEKKEAGDEEKDKD